MTLQDIYDAFVNGGSLEEVDEDMHGGNPASIYQRWIHWNPGRGVYDKKKTCQKQNFPSYPTPFDMIDFQHKFTQFVISLYFELPGLDLYLKLPDWNSKFL